MIVTRIALHLLIFAVAVLVFFLGLSQNPAIGTLLWVIAAGIAVGNAVWMARLRR